MQTRRNTPQRTPVQLKVVVGAGRQLLTHMLRLDNVRVQEHLSDDWLLK
jgi:hypothetical protein